MADIRLDASLENLPFIPKRFLPKLKRLEIKTVKDLLWHFPTRYEDWSEISPIADLHPGDEKTIQGEVISISLVRTPRRRMFVVKALISDESASISAVWFNQPYIKQSLPVGKLVSFSGKATLYKNKLVLQSPKFEPIQTRIGADKSAQIGADKSSFTRDTRHTARIIPIYPETKGLTSKGIRYLVQSVLDGIQPLQEFVPGRILGTLQLPEINQALRQIHFPEKRSEAAGARKSFAFRDLFLLQLKNLEQKEALRKQRAYPIQCNIGDIGTSDNLKINGDIRVVGGPSVIGSPNIKMVLGELPFELTPSQKKSLLEILHDIAKPHPMNRLLQGDVGSGKTIVAGVAALALASPPSSLQAVFMAPTEILARQHYQTLTKFFVRFGGGIALLIAKEARVFYGDELETPVKKSHLIKDIAGGKVKIVIGTHALIQKEVGFQKLALAVVDEQHRFGVKQRATLSSRGSEALVPHFLSMSATPIPRTLMLSVFGDLDLSLISELPKGRKNIITKIVDPSNRDKAYAFIRGEVRKGKQVFVVCPRIESRVPDPNDPNTSGSTNLQNSYSGHLDKFVVSDRLSEVKSVKEEYEKLAKEVFPDLRVAMLHGKLKSDEKKKVMTDFAQGETDILVSTSVIEVGVDVPNATIMMIEGAERFGLAQLYQFRGRVGRGEKQSFCFLFTESSSKTTSQRLQALLTAKNGFELAEEDLKIRGPGEFLGQSQTGLPDHAMRALQSPELLKEARAAAEEILKDDPALENYPLLKERLGRFKKEIHLE